MKAYRISEVQFRHNCSICCKEEYHSFVKVKVTLRLTVSQSVSLEVGLKTRCLLLCDSYGLVYVGRPL
jgi:hypothetical protein